jgi:hypothetical protein
VGGSFRRSFPVELLEPKGFGRVRIEHLRELDSEARCGFVGSVVTPGAMVLTDGRNVDTPLAETSGEICPAARPVPTAVPRQSDNMWP